VLAEAFEIRRSVVVVESETVATPMVCGVWRPLIVMPKSAAEWSDERRRVVVLHELAHIKRRDCLTQAVAQIVCAAYWFNPLAWLAARRLRAERERACDDFVLAAGATRADYASHLLDIAQTMQRRQLSPLAGVAMARPSQLEGRLLAILDPAIRRSSALYARLASVASVLLITVPVGSVRLQSPMPIADEMDAAADIGPVPMSLAPNQTATPTPTPTPQPRSRVASPGVTDVIADHVVIADAVADALTDSLGAGIGQEIAAAMAAQTSVAADPKTVEALIGALADPDPDVREMVVSTLGRMRDPRVVDALLPLLKDGNADVREQAVAALAHTGDPRAATAVAAMIDDVSPEIREQAVHFLGRARNRETMPALLKALKDPSADVREQAAYSLGQFRDVSAVDPLLDLLKDPSPDVREQTVYALGQTRDGRAVDGLIATWQPERDVVSKRPGTGRLRDSKALPSLVAALRDADADVREQAAHAIGQISGQE
jgi:HEAT repeat protein